MFRFDVKGPVRAAVATGPSLALRALIAGPLLALRVLIGGAMPTAFRVAMHRQNRHADANGRRHGTRPLLALRALICGPSLTLGVLIGVVLVGGVCGCAPSGPYGRPGEMLERLGDEIVVCGQLYHTGAPVVLWTDPGGYDAYRAECRFAPDQLAPSKPVSDSPVRYGTFRRHLPEDVAERVRAEGWRPELLAEWVDLFVMHYDVCGTSRRCFKVLQDMRGLSVHFMLDLDGTIYQTLDVKERAWHAGSANDRSVGVEIANMGAYPDMETLDQWYARDESGRTFVRFPDWVGETGIRTPEFVARPARNDVVHGEINGRELMQYDLTDEQYDSLIKLTATLCEALPGITVDVPRDADGSLRTSVLTAEEISGFSGLIGHWHVVKRKVDPGPAFDWERVLAGVREIAE